MTTAATTLTETPNETSRQRPFVFELLSLIAKVFAAALAINLVFAAIVLLFASQASADSPSATPSAVGMQAQSASAETTQR